MIAGVAGAAGLAMALLGWAPGATWDATPRDLLLALDGRIAVRRALAPPAAGRADLEDLKTRIGG
ncbi:phage tail assembly chaperone [Zavarzinia compransoris]|uniref:phage tail assembly chaperone n=1 Tax=Zavarzinia marina TaxID=2911065 RepID=UPI001F18BA7B|nr:phage tail assembly chaperone [Zavarzinia marina]MCF4166472.1 phage tail assembly chaperone [Zavarzinia marina]